MKIIDNKIENFELSYPLEALAPLDELLLLDIETTGFTARSSQLYLIGIVYRSAGAFRTRQWFAETADDETEILTSFFDFASDYKYLIHYNGNNFDLPYLQNKIDLLGLNYNFESFIGIDLYKRISPYKYFLKLPNCKQKTIETFLNIQRDDTFSGGDLINVYHDYLNSPSDFSEAILLLHNADDLKGMLSILPILSFYDIFEQGVKIKSVQANTYKTITGEQRQELIMTVTLPSVLPKEISSMTHMCFFRGAEQLGQIRVPILTEEMKYFYANYKDYYYLPLEDEALHKSIATYVDKDYRQQATAANCYTRKYSSYLPQWDIIIEPFFKRDYKSKELFFELTDEIKKDRELFTKYANHILKMIASTY